MSGSNRQRIARKLSRELGIPYSKALEAATQERATSSALPRSKQATALFELSKCLRRGETLHASVSQALIGIEEDPSLLIGRMELNPYRPFSFHLTGMFSRDVVRLVRFGEIAGNVCPALEFAAMGCGQRLSEE